MTNNKEREFEEIMDKIFGTEPSRYSAWNKELFLQMFNEAYAKGRQSVLSKLDTPINRYHFAYDVLEGVYEVDDDATSFSENDIQNIGNEILSKLSDDKSG